MHDGVVAGHRAAAQGRDARRAGLTVPPLPKSEGLELVFRPDPTIWDGRFANNGWLQELPKPLTKLTWDNAGAGQPGHGRAARALDRGDVVELSTPGGDG